MSSIDYWRKREEEQESEIFENNKVVVNKIKIMYKKTLEEINNKINKHILEFSDNNGKLSISKAKEVLKNKELKEFQMNVEEYIKLASKNNVTPKENIKLINASLKHRIDRLEALKTEIHIELNKLSSKYVEITENRLGEIYKDVYVDTSNYYSGMLGKGDFITALDKKAINKAVNELWANDGLRFSDRIWLERNKLSNELYTRLFQGVALGRNAFDLITNISQYSKDKVENVAFNIARLLQTEASVIRSKATFESYKESGIDKYQVVATLDGLTCDRCGEFDYKIYNIKDKVIGVNCNPFHPLCRCTTVPYYDWLDKDSNVVISEDKLKEYEDWKKGNVIDSSKKKRYNKEKEEKKVDLTKFTDFTNEDIRKLYLKLGDEDYNTIYANKLDGTFDINTGYIMTKNSYKINKALRTNDYTNLSEANKKVVSTLDNVISKTKLHKDTKFYRFVEQDFLGFLDNSLVKYGERDNPDIRKALDYNDVNIAKSLLDKFKVLVGKTFDDKGFVSTSFDKKLNCFKDYNVMLEVYTPRGTEVYVTENFEESEVIIGRNSNFKIIDISIENLHLQDNLYNEPGVYTHFNKIVLKVLKLN